MNKQELIDEVVRRYKGIWPNENVPQIMFGTFENNWDLNPKEFKKRARELGFINGFEWGKEYPTNGEKPNLPDDVIIDRKYSNGWTGLQIEIINCAGWSHPKAFRIVDKRYKPKGTSMNNNNSDNSWHERGDLPPVDSTVESKPYWHTCYVVCDYLDGRLIHDKHEDSFYVARKGIHEFRPIKSEREKFIDAVISVIDTSHSYRTAAGDMFDAGFRAPSDKE